MTLQQHQRLRWWLPVATTIVLYLIFAFVEHGAIVKPTLATSIVFGVCFLALQFVVALLPADCPKCGKRLKFQRSLGDSDGSGDHWYEYYCFKCKRVITWERSSHYTDYDD